jgi:hypothetical protein
MTMLDIEHKKKEIAVYRIGASFVFVTTLNLERKRE